MRPLRFLYGYRHSERDGGGRVGRRGEGRGELKKIVWRGSDAGNREEKRRKRDGGQEVGEMRTK